MSDQDLRQLLGYPDADLTLPGLPAITSRARVRQRRQRVGLMVAAGVTVVLAALIGTRLTDLRQNSMPAVSPTPSTVIGAGAARQAFPLGGRNAVGHGWTMWLTGFDRFCWRHKPTSSTGAREPGQGPTCRDLSQLERGELQLLVLDTEHGGALYMGLVPWSPTRVSLLVNGRHHDADFAGFANTSGWSYYHLWLSASDHAAQVVVYDLCGQPHTRAPVTPGGGEGCDR